VKYLDANVIIRLLEADAPARQTLTASLQGTPGGFVTSELSRLECRCRPMKLGDLALLKLYDAFFSSADLRLVPMDRSVIDKATELRATTRLRTPDALHLAAALIGHAACFYTGDLHFQGITQIPIQIL
jgi:uncharacterized protein